MKRISILISSLFLATTVGAAAENEPLLKERDQEKLGKLFADYFSGRKANDMRQYSKAFEALQKEMASKAKSAKVDSLLLSPVDMRVTFGTAIDPVRSPKKGIVKKYSDSEKLMDGAFEFEYLLWAPRSYRPGTPVPVVLFLHPRGMVEDDLQDWVEKLLPPEALEAAIVVAPLGSGDWEAGEGLMRAFFSLRRVWDGYSVDRLRLFLMGSGDAATSAVTYITNYPGTFAAAILRDMVAAPDDAMLGNAKETPILMLSPEGGDTAQVMGSFADAAKAKEVEGVELVQTDLGKDGSPGAAGAEALNRFITGTVKNVAPERLKFTTVSNDYASYYWLQLTDFEATDKKPVTVEAEIDRAKNEIHVTTPESVHGFTIYVNEALLDTGKAIRVLHTVAADGDTAVKPEVRYEGTKPPSLEQALAIWFANPSGNSGEVYTNLISVELPR